MITNNDDGQAFEYSLTNFISHRCRIFMNFLPFGEEMQVCINFKEKKNVKLFGILYENIFSIITIMIILIFGILDSE